MADDKPISDVEAHERLLAARKLIGPARGETKHGDHALEAGRMVLSAAMWMLIRAMEERDAATDPHPPETSAQKQPD